MSRCAGGQWAMGYRELLNGSDRIKRDDDGLNVRARIIDRYSREGFGSIHPDDLRGRVRWWGLHTQRIAGPEVTDRQDAQFHWVRIEDVPAVSQALELPARRGGADPDPAPLPAPATAATATAVSR